MFQNYALTVFKRRITTYWRTYNNRLKLLSTGSPYCQQLHIVQDIVQELWWSAILRHRPTGQKHFHSNTAPRLAPNQTDQATKRPYFTRCWWLTNCTATYALQGLSLSVAFSTPLFSPPWPFGRARVSPTVVVTKSKDIPCCRYRNLWSCKASQWGSTVVRQNVY